MLRAIRSYACFEYLESFIDSWPIGGSIEVAWYKWNDTCDPMALTVLSRANEIIEQVGGSPLIIPAPKEIPPYREIRGEQIAELREELCRQALCGEISGVHFLTPIPIDKASQLALGELRMEASGQSSLERFGPIGLLASSAPNWSNCFGSAPSGKRSDTLVLMCDLALLPSTPKRLFAGELEETAWLLWNGPARPLPIHRVVYEVLKLIPSGLDTIPQTLGIPEPTVNQMIEELLSIGALGSAS